MKTSRDIVKHLYNEKLAEKPRTFTEKLRWKMKYDRRPILTLTADKYRVIDYLKQNGFGNLLKKLYFVTDNPAEIPFDDLPERYIIKSSHSSGDIMIIDGGFDLVTKDRVGRWELIVKCNQFLRRRHWNELNEWAYQGIKPVIIVEEFLSDENGLPPVDFKFLCFDGKASIVEVIEDRYGDYTDNYFDMNWQPLDFTWSDWLGITGGPPGDNVQRPANFGEMIRIAGELSKLFDFVRVDLYNVMGKIYFGEFTHYPSGGIGEIEPRSFDAWMGSLWTLPDIDTVKDYSFLSRINEAYYSLYYRYNFWRYK
ncbi:MAG TPA: ATP-grasp fold amidoligase family protein [Thermodesulfobacteriota bacterium]|nr:ATP-grasp fold amidoligase family protein [Thermodesulfobacteriota bacterium]